MSGDPVWVNGSLGGRIDPADRGLTLGDGVFDTLVSFRRMPFAGERHMARLVAHAEAIGISLDPTEVRRGWDAVIGAAADENIILRTTVTRGITTRGLWPKSPGSSPTVVVAATAWDRAVVGRPVRLIVSSITRNAASATSRLKTINYLDNILAARKAAEKGGDDALLLNADGNVACSTIANIFALSGGRLLTPPLADGVLAGIIRGLIMETAAAAGIETVELSLQVMDLFAADEVFLTNSVRLVSRVLSIDSRPILGGRDADRVAMLLAGLAKRIRSEHGFELRGG